MTARMRLRAAGVAAVLGAATIAGCGGGSSSGSATTQAGKAGPSSHAAAEKIIRQAIAANPKATSGRIDGTVDLHIKGVPRFKGTLEVTVDGTYNLPAGATVPDFDMDVGLTLNGPGLAGTLVLAHGNGFVELGDTGYPLPDAINAQLAAPAPAAHNALTKTAAMFYINPQNWQKNAQLVGDTNLMGVNTHHITADLRPAVVFADIGRLTDLLTALHVTQAVGFPTALDSQVQAALVRSVRVAKGEVWIGASDNVLRQAHLQGTLVVSPRDRKVLGGVTGATIDAVINVSDVGQPERIVAPKRMQSYASLQVTLNALAQSIRNPPAVGTP
jgi:hypothetical protein